MAERQQGEPRGSAAMALTENAHRARSGLVLLTLASGQFLMTLDSSVMNVSIATVAKDVGTTVTGIQTAITFYTLVMASLMITGGKLGQILGRKRAFAIGCVIYGCGSFITAISQSLTVLIIGWSVLEGVGAALILPAIVALVASNFDAVRAAARVRAGRLGGRDRGRRRTADRRAVHHLRVVALGVRGRGADRAGDPRGRAADRRRPAGHAAAARPRRDRAVGARPGSDRVRNPQGRLVGVRPAQAGGSDVARPLAGDLADARRRSRGLALLRLGEPAAQRGAEPLIDPSILLNRTLRGGLTSFFFQYLLQAGLFFAVPLFLSVSLGLSAIATGVRLLPLSITLLLAAAGIPKVFPNASPRRVVRIGFLLLFAGLVVMVGALDSGAGADIVTWPMLLAGLGIGALASQLGSVTVSSVPDEQSGEVGGLQNTVTNLGASIGTALSGAVLIAALTTSLVGGHPEQPGGAGRREVQGSDRAGQRRPVPVRQGPARGARRRPACPSRPPMRSSRRTRRPARRSALIAVGDRRHRPDRAVHDAVHPDPAAPGRGTLRLASTRPHRCARSEKLNQAFDHEQTAQHAKRGRGDATPVMPDRCLGPVDRVLRPIRSDCEAEQRDL